MIGRRRFLVGAAAIFALPLASVRGQAPQHARVGFLMAIPRAASILPDLLPSALRELGWIEGRNLTLEWRYADGQLARLPGLASELVQQGVQVIIAPGNPEVLAAREVTRSIPIVTIVAIDPVMAGLAKSLARPGGNVTGVVWGDQTLTAKLTELIKQSVPGMRRLGMLYVPEPVMESYAVTNEAGARALGLTFYRLKVQRPEDVEVALRTVKDEQIDALYVVVPGGAIGSRLGHILEFATSNRIPTVYPGPLMVERGGFMSYSPKLSESVARAAAMVDKILKGANPADMPFEYPLRYQLVINLKTAKAFGIKVPQSVLLRADRVIE